MTKDFVPTSILDTQFLTTIWPYAVFIILAVTSLQFLRLVISTVVTILRLLARFFVLVISWPIYLILLPARALLFLTKLAIKIAFYVAMVAILYRLLGGAVNSEMIKETFREAFQFVHATFLL